MIVRVELSTMSGCKVCLDTVVMSGDDVCRVGNSLLLGHCPFGLDVTLILRAPRPPFIQALGQQGQF